MAASGGVSVLAAMTQAVAATEPKDKRPKANLTGLAGEVPGPSILETSPIPNRPGGTIEHDPDIILGRLKDVRREVEAILASVTALEVAWGAPEQATAEAAAVDQALLEREADRQAADREKAAAGDAKAAARIEAVQSKGDMVAAALGDEDFPARMERLKEEAQSAVYTGNKVVDAAIKTAVEDPTAGPAEVMAAAMAAAEWTCPEHGQRVTKQSARRQREYGKCPVEGCPEFEKL